MSSPFAETHPLVHTPEDAAELETKGRKDLFGLPCVLISAMLTIGAVASLIMSSG